MMKYIPGATLCLCIVVCNTCVIWELCRIKSQHRILVRRISRSIINNRVGVARYQTPEEVAFAKFMAVVCIIFVVCWAPQIVSIKIIIIILCSGITFTWKYNHQHKFNCQRKVRKSTSFPIWFPCSSLRDLLQSQHGDDCFWQLS